MKNGILCAVLGVILCMSFFEGSPIFAQEGKVAVINPRGALPPIRLVPMAPRLDTLEGKTVYLIATSFAVPLMPELQKLLTERYPQTTWVLKDKGGSYFADAPDLWAEVKQKGSAVIMGVGH